MTYFPVTILLATDGSKDSELAAEAAADLAKKTGSELHVLYAMHSVGEQVFYHNPEDSPMLSKEESERKGRRLLDEQTRKINYLGVTVAGTHLQTGDPRKVIVRTGESIGAGLIVIGSRGRGALRRTLMGSISNSVVHHAHCPVMVVRRE